MKALELVLVYSVCTASAHGAIIAPLHSATTDTIASTLLSAAGSDGRTGLSVDELTLALGKWDRTEEGGVLMDRPTIIYEMSEGRELQFVTSNGSVLYGAIKKDEKHWDLVWK